MLFWGPGPPGPPWLGLCFANKELKMVITLRFRIMSVIDITPEFGAKIRSNEADLGELKERLKELGNECFLQVSNHSFKKGTSRTRKGAVWR